MSEIKFVTLEEQQMRDVLSRTEFGVEPTELLLNTVPGLTGPQILRVRQNVLEVATKRGDGSTTRRVGVEASQGFRWESDGPGE